MSERKYRMTCVFPGDWLMPANDRASLWRVYRYREDGSAIVQREDGSHYEIHGMFWAAARYRLPLDQIPESHFENNYLEDDPQILNWDNWHTQVHMLKTRKEAAEYAATH